MRARLALVFAIASLADGCSCGDTSNLGGLVPNLESPSEIDFGDVQVGLTNTREIMISNTGQIPLAIGAKPGVDGTTDTYAFMVDPPSLSLGPGQSAPLTIGFRSDQAMPDPVTSTIELTTDGKKADGSLFTASIQVRGRGVRASISVDPNPLDFGTVLVGSSLTADLRVTNLLATPIDLTTQVDAGGAPVVISEMGQGQFVVLAQSGAAIGTLAGGASTTIQVRYTPDPLGAGQDRARWKISSCPEALCDVKVVFIGRGSVGALSCVPATLAIGAVNPGHTASRVVRCTDVASDPVEILGWSLDPNSSPELTAQPSMTSTLAPGSSIDIAVSLAPPPGDATLGAQYTGTLIVRGRNLVTSDGFDPSRVPITGSAGGPHIRVLPTGLFFGQVEIHTHDRRSVVVVNDGYSDLMLTTRTMADPSFVARNRQTMLATGTATTIDVTFAPTSVGSFTGSLLLDSNDAEAPEVTIPLSGDGVSIGPCTATITPSILSFGLVPVGDLRGAPVDIINTGQGTCLVNHLAIRPLAGTSSLAFSIPQTPGSFTLGPGMRQTVDVAYQPLNAGPDHGVLEMYVSDPAASLPTVDLAGSGFSTTRVDCPPPVSVDAGHQTSIQVHAMSRTGTITSYAWEITSAPTGGIGTPDQWNPDPPALATELFRPYLIGRYDIRVTITDSDNLTATCTTAVTALSHGLRVELNWDGFGDVDLHLHNGNRTPWFGRGATLGAEDDCFYANCSQSAVVVGPIWDPTSNTFEGGNPGLDFDNIVALGPENTHVDRVNAGDSFTVALHYFWDHGFGPRIATTNIYCGRVAFPTATFTSTTMIGLDQGGCTQNTFWKVATVTFTSSATCNIQPLQIYEPGSDACASF